ncbi:target of EGR1 protein 1-like isoform X2 [Tubulanus polymorphus]|uniref:target of EGR1 protein 1-like isoform X2 n=1 Tax=Tubulanus polymorphus TaxID=672921 RepID=UPI003DA6B2A3
MSSANFHEVPVVDVTRDNIVEIWPSLQFSLQQAMFVALDLEMSGIGNRKTLMAKSIDDRYRGLCETARTRSILSIGLSCFCHNTSSDTENISDANLALKFTVHTYNITVLCEDNYTVEPLSLTFLVEHGFDFNKQYMKGVYYHREDKKKKDTSKPCLRRLFQQLITNEVPIVFHNALVDLVFLYQNLYTQLPANLSQFTADLSEMFPSGIYDTKFVTEFMERTPASYLEYIFRKRQKDNLEQCLMKEKHILIDFPKYPASCDYVEQRGCSLDSEQNQNVKLCECFSNHGWCALGKNCPNSHDVDAILRKEDVALVNKQRKRNRRKRARPGSESTIGECATVEERVASVTVNDNSNNAGLTGDCSQESSDIDIPQNGEQVQSNVVTKSRCEGHRAGFDAFMTGFTMGTFIAKYGKSVSDNPIKLSDFGIQELVNRIYLSGKDYALQIKKSDFSKPSKGHRIKIQMLKGEIT